MNEQINKERNKESYKEGNVSLLQKLCLVCLNKMFYFIKGAVFCEIKPKQLSCVKFASLVLHWSDEFNDANRKWNKL